MRTVAHVFLERESQNGTAAGRLRSVYTAARTYKKLPINDLPPLMPSWIVLATLLHSPVI
jgi:hypothetical protein